LFGLMKLLPGGSKPTYSF